MADTAPRLFRLRLRDGVWQIDSAMDADGFVELVGFDERPTMYLRNGRRIREHLARVMEEAEEILDA